MTQSNADITFPVVPCGGCIILIYLYTYLLTYILVYLYTYLLTNNLFNFTIYYLLT
jgi:hypothetical protein